MATAEIHITLKPSLLDVQGATTLKALHQLGHSAVRSARIGKYIVLEIDDADDLALQEQLSDMCRQLLANPVIEDYDITFDQNAEAGENDGAASTREVVVLERKSGTDKVAAATATSETSPVKSLGGVTVAEPFAVDYLSYTGMSTDEQLALQELAWQKHEGWIAQQLQDFGAVWILCVGGEVADAGDTLDSLPDETRLAALGQAKDLVPWVFRKQP